MEEKYRNKIYDRLLSMKVDIEMKSFPHPQYINEKIGQCHVYIDEVERYSIETSKEISIKQQAVNNAEADYDTKKEELLINNDDIKKLPNIRDREAKANSMLKEELKSIRGYINDLTDLNNLLKSINLKIKNLNRTNADIKMMVRVMESQIKLGIAPDTDKVTQSLIQEMDKGINNSDSFEDVEVEESEEDVIDPTEDLDINELLNSDSDNEDKSEDIKEKDTTFEEKEKSDICELKKAEPTIEDSEAVMVEKGLIDPLPDFDKTLKEPVVLEDTPVLEEDWPFNLDGDTSQKDKVSEDKTEIDLDSAINFINQKERGGQKEETETEKNIKTDNNQKKDRQQKSDKIGLDIDDLLDNIN